MNPAVLSLLALIVALVVSMTSRINVGWLAIAFAWLVGVYGAGLRPDVVLAGFPAACAALSACSLAFELGSPLAIARPLRWIVLGAGVLFHLGTWIFLGITFWPLVATYLVCVPWTRLATATGRITGLGVPLDTPPRARQ